MSIAPDEISEILAVSFRRGMPVHIVQHFLEHRDIMVTSQRYAHLAPISLLGAVNVLEVHEGDNVVGRASHIKHEASQFYCDA